MWILKFLPNWLFYAILISGAIGLLVSKFVPGYYRSAVQAVSVAFFAFGVFMAGAINDNEAWVARVKEMEAKVAEVKVESQKENVKVETKYLTRVQVVKQRGDDIIQYVDREVVKYDSQCVIPKEFIISHNKAAEQPK